MPFQKQNLGRLYLNFVLLKYNVAWLYRAMPHFLVFWNYNFYVIFSHIFKIDYSIDLFPLTS